MQFLEVRFVLIVALLGLSDSDAPLAFGGDDSPLMAPFGGESSLPFQPPQLPESDPALDALASGSVDAKAAAAGVLSAVTNRVRRSCVICWQQKQKCDGER